MYQVRIQPLVKMGVFLFYFLMLCIFPKNEFYFLNCTLTSNTLQYQDYNTKIPIPRYTTNTLPIPIHYHYQYTTTTNTLQYQDTLQYQYTPIPSNTKQYTSNTLTSNSKHDEAVALYIRGAFIRFESSHWLSLLKTELFVF